MRYGIIAWKDLNTVDKQKASHYPNAYLQMLEETIAPKQDRSKPTWKIGKNSK